MITQELTEYVRAELAKGRTREEIRKVLLAGGGWSEVDIDQAFRAVAPIGSIDSNTPYLNTPDMSSVPTVFPPIEIKPQAIPQGISLQQSTQGGGELKTETPMVTYHITRDTALLKHKVFPWKTLLVVFIIGALGFNLWWFYPQIKSSYNSLFSVAVPEEVIPAPVPIVEQQNPVIGTVSEIKDCGVTSAGDLSNPALYDKDSVFACLGQSALNCVNAKGTLQNSFFPTIFQVVNKGNTCDFKLSYTADSTLTDMVGNKLASRFIECKVDIVKAMDKNPAKATVFKPPSKDNVNRYATEIYLYGTVGVFLENNFDINKIASVGCSGDYIQSVVDSYHAAGTKP